MSFLQFAAIYVIGFVAIFGLSQYLLRNEPTDHGQIVGTQIGCAFALTWPLSLPLGLLAFLYYGATLRCTRDSCKAWQPFNYNDCRKCGRVIT